MVLRSGGSFDAAETVLLKNARMKGGCDQGLVDAASILHHRLFQSPDPTDKSTKITSCAPATTNTYLINTDT